MAPEIGLEPITRRLTAGCSTIELLWKPRTRNVTDPNISRQTHSEHGALDGSVSEMRRLIFETAAGAKGSSKGPPMTGKKLHAQHFLGYGLSYSSQRH
jgi:hypothetical protein